MSVWLGFVAFLVSFAGCTALLAMYQMASARALQLRVATLQGAQADVPRTSWGAPAGWSHGRLSAGHVSAGHWKLAWLAVCALVAVKVGVVPALVVVTASVLGGKVARAIGEHRRLNAYEQSLPIALDSVARSLRSGAGMHIALAEAGETGAGVDLRRVARETHSGVGLTEALDGWAQRVPTPSVKLCADSLVLAIEAGGSNARAVEQVVATLRQHLSAGEAVKTAATEARVSAGLLVVLPVLVSIPVLVTNSGAQQFMFHHPVGVGLLMLGLSLDGLGALWMHRLVKRATS